MLSFNFICQTIFLGIIQGLTEFLPVSSSGHLVIFQQFFPQIKADAVVFNLILHLGTLFALIVFFFKDLRKIFSSRLLVLNILLATVITAIIVFPFRKTVEGFFQNPKLAGVMLMITAVILFLASKRKNNKQEVINYPKAAFIGLGQAIAVIPGISRSGTTISFGIFSGLKSKTSAYFSFLIAVPAVLGACILEFKEIASVSFSHFFPYLFGFIAAFVSGLIALRWLIKLISLRQEKLIYFAYYCFFIGLIAILLV